MFKQAVCFSSLATLNSLLSSILSAIGTLTYKLAIFLSTFLEPLSKVYNNRFLSFSEELKNFSIESFHDQFRCRITFHKDYKKQKMFFGNKKYLHDISKDSFRGLLTLAMHESFALFNNEHYKQLDGVGTGYPLKATFANIFLCLHEIIWLNILQNSHLKARGL